MKFSGTIDTKRMRVVNEAIADRQIQARERALREVGAWTARKIAEGVGYDTGRTRRAWRMAHNDLSLRGKLPPGELRPSRFIKRIAERLLEQERALAKSEKRWLRNVERDERRAGHQKWKSYREKLRILEKIAKVRDRAIEVLEAAGVTVDGDTVGGFTGMKNGVPLVLLPGRNLKKGKGFGLSHLARVSDKLYGGYGRVLLRGESSTVVEIGNAEPHARLVESKTRAGRRAFSLARQAGLMRISRAYAAELRAAAPANFHGRAA